MHAAFYCLIRWPSPSDARPRDQALFEALGIPAVRRTTRQGASPWGPELFAVNLRGWRLLAGGYDYALQRAARLEDPSRLPALSRGAEVFAFTRPDADMAYDFIHLLDGRVARERCVSSPSYVDQRVLRDHGPPMRGETPALLSGDPDEIGFALARGLGIDLDLAGRTIRFYRTASKKS